MDSVGKIAAWLGVVTGAWIVLGAYLGQGGTMVVSHWGSLTQVLGVILAVASILSMVGPRKVFYFSALVSVLVVASIGVALSGLDTTAILTVGLALVNLVLDIVAARRETRVSEQSHPMNLPVFG
ncbi:MAG: hypothetical protein KGI38_00175 [Thaumarchaeota archaeon]|nr:hypothetical protein [Nitrososphaerota archaeon]